MLAHTKVTRNYGFIKGGLAEVIVERLFTTIGFDVYPCGIEKKLPANLLRMHRQSKMSVFARSENDPDFIVWKDTEHRDKPFVQAIEVKFRTDGTIKLSELEKYGRQDIVFVLLDTEDIYALHSDDAKRFGKKNGGAGIVIFKDCARLADYESIPFLNTERHTIRAFAPMIKGTLGQYTADKDIISAVETILKAPRLLKGQKYFSNMFNNAARLSS